ncbi:DUF350 domain-containing protein [Leeia sp. TBRC 13508]|uniref:DUF350 domain-containing protein n=1 Tax=Leeia speluncae TaxID=2884804 RepID=A0ABS8D4Q7_9NEIS|nr:DUF350 domain-containing protein [Leeia speluncae]MCB6183180.1 DUF350 domain-containing protein [Leeia speluncae]
MHLPGISSYLVFLLSGFGLLLAFMLIYTKTTVINEFQLIKEGNIAAALSLAGAVLGFSLTLASSALHSNGIVPYLLWASVAMVIQLLTYLLVSRCFPTLNTELANNNAAMGLLVGTISLTTGIINAACLS